MSTSVTFNSLSGIISSELTYSYKSQEELNKEIVHFSNGLTYKKHAIFSNLQDAVISKNNLVFLTDSIQLSSALTNTRTTLQVLDVPSLVYLKQVNSATYITIEGNSVVGRNESDATKQPLFFSLIGPNKAEILISNEYRLEVAKSYPYQVYISKKATTAEQKQRQQFDIDFADNKLTIQTTTANGKRFLAIDCLSNVGATGLILNEGTMNNYLFEVESITRNEITKGLALGMEHVKYFNQFETFGNKKNVAIQESNQANTHWLVSTTLEQLINNTDNVNVNIMPLKTNFTPAGTFLTKPNE